MSTRLRGAPLRLAVSLPISLALVAGSACADTTDGPLVTEDPVPEETVPEATVAATSTAPPEDPQSEATAEIGEIRYRFEVACHDLGAGDVKVVGVGEDPVTGGQVELLVNASLVDPYVGLRLEDDTYIEPSLDSQLDLYVQDDVIRASAIRFVRDLDLETGDATEVGFGEFEIHCYSYERETPG